ncbi:MAG: phosphatidylserine/phosphatidylglycerophosphate/cardiolipin synthase family protein [Dehalococcoidia bacterium]
MQHEVIDGPVLPSRITEHALARTSGALLREGNRLALLQNGDETYEDWLRAIRDATRWVHFENYIFRDDEIGTRFAEALSERARAGVVVRVMYDWFGSWDVSASFWNNMREAGVDVRVINPPELWEPLAVFRRDHRKLLAVDGTYGSVGGVGVADPWLQRAPETGLPYRDTAVAVSGPAVADIELAFASVWDLNGPGLPATERPRAEDLAPAGDTATRVVIQEPGKMRISRLLQVLTASVQDRIWIADAYFLADRILREALIAAALDGIDVRLLLPSTNDLRIVGALSRTSYRPLLEAGARIWEYRGPMMHAKTIVADGWCSRVGSTNLNVTGLMTNWEIDVVVEDINFATAMEQMFLADLADAQELTLEGRAVRGGPRRQRVRSLVRGSGPQVPSTVASLGGALAQGALSDALARNERNFNLATGFGGLVLAGVLARFPRALAWPLATVVGLFGATGLARAFRYRRPPTS